LDDIKTIENENYIKEIRQYKLITPLYGGGEEPAKPDSVTVIRGSEVRGHLRFWWRATRGGQFNGDLQEMKKREDEIWGSAAGKDKPGVSEVKVFINKLTSNRGTKFQAVDRDGKSIRNVGHPNSKDGYVAFPLRDSQNPEIWQDVSFHLEIQYPKFTKNNINLQEEVQEALWAWETFGGIGARTRRGFGSLRLTHINNIPEPEMNVEDTQKNIVAKLSKYSVDNYWWHKGVPHLTDDIQRYRFIRKDNEIDAWRFVVQKLRDFRQLFRDQKRGRPFGRSHWPEPDQVRRKTGNYINPGHSPKHAVQKFPRAKFGLPIIFEFKKEDVTAGDPQKTTLQGIKLPNNKYIERLASPVILRSIACSDGAIGLALILDWEPINETDEEYIPPGGLLLRGESKDYPSLESDLKPSEAKHIPPLNGNPDVLQAFLNFLGN
jgi:CRISPR-associated protein Cmr1